ncbi:MAG: type II toxin-antitoxin system VapC family toxin [Synechococcaceae cyanobacterium SM2_3_2]|nr:type II toxin-antitoxin system VapC family toxin [Synechococcaceae cyanobacterium SM2_3_2]
MSEVIVLDTHIWIWYINGNDERLPAGWLDRIESADTLGVASVSSYEITLAHQRQRLELPIPPEAWFEDALAPAGIQLFPLTPAIACRAVSLSSIHKDPFDRLIIATALGLKAMLASIDSNFAKYPELAETLMPP